MDIEKMRITGSEDDSITLNDSKIRKRIIVHGERRPDSSQNRLHDGSIVYLHLTSRLSDSDSLLLNYSNRQFLTYSYGDESLAIPRILKYVIPSMNVGETCSVEYDQSFDTTVELPKATSAFDHSSEEAVRSVCEITLLEVSKYSGECCNSRFERMKRRKDRANEKFTSGDYEAALVDYDMIHFTLTSILFELPNKEETIQTIDDVNVAGALLRQVQEYSATILLNRGMCFLKLKEYNNVVKEYERLLKLYATLDVLPPPKLFYRLSMAFSSLSDASSAFQALENGLRLYPNHRELTVESKKLKADTKRIERVWGNLVGEYLKNGGDESATIDNETQSEDAKFVKEEEKDVFGLVNVEGCESEEESLWPSEATAGSIKNYSDLDVEDTSNDEIIPSGHGSHDLERALCGEEEEEIEWGKHSEQELEAWKQLWTDKEGENSNTTVPSASTTDICSDQLQEHKPSVPTELPLSPPPSPAALLDTIDLKDVHMSLLKSFSVNVTYSVNSIRNQILTNVKALWDVRKKWKNWDGLEADESQSAVGSQINEDNTEESKGKTSKKPTRLFNIEEYADEVVLLIMERMALQRMIGMVTVGGSIGAAGKIIVYPSFSGSSKCSTADSDREEEEEMRKQSELIEANLPLRPIPELPIPWNEIRRKVSLFELYEELTNVYHPEMSFMLTKVINWLRSGSKQVASLCKDIENRGVMGEEFKFSPSAGLSETDEELERKKKKEKEKINKLKPIYQSICVRIVRGLVDIGVARLVEVKGIGAKVRITFRILDVDELGQLKWQKDGHCDDIGGDISDEESAEDDGRGTNGGLSITDVL